MAAAQSRAMVLVNDVRVGYLIFEFNNLNHLFAGGPAEEFPPILSLPEPAARFNHGVAWDCLTIAVSGNLVAAVAADDARTLLCDTGSRSISAGPDMLSSKPAIVLVPVAGMFFAMSRLPHRDPEGAHHFELLLRLHDTEEEEEENRRRWAWLPIPDPPLLSSPEWYFSACFVAGAHIWVSICGEGTFTFDTARRRWHKEGTWELPVMMGQAILVPDFLGDSRQLLFGFCSKEEGGHFCAVDMEARPPAIIKSWPEARFSRLGYRPVLETASLAYFGGGRFCISMLIDTGYIYNYKPFVTNDMTNNLVRLTRQAITFSAVEVTPELQLLIRKDEWYSMPLGSTLCSMYNI